MGVSLEQTSEKCDRQANTAIHLVERGKKQNNVDSCKWRLNEYLLTEGFSGTNF